MMAVYLEGTVGTNLQYNDIPRGSFTFNADDTPKSRGARFVCDTWELAIKELRASDDLKALVSTKPISTDARETAIKRIKREWKATNRIPAASGIKVYQGEDWTFF